MITHEILMKHFSTKLKNSYKYHQRKLDELGTTQSPPEQAVPVTNRGVNIRSLVGARRARARYSEGEDGESYIDILYGYSDRRILTLTSYGHITLYFKRPQIYTREINTVSIVCNLFLPPNALLERKGSAFVLGTEHLLSRFKEVSVVSFDSNFNIRYGLNMMPVAAVPATKKVYTSVKNTVADAYLGKLKLLGGTQVKILVRKAYALREDIEPKYMQLMSCIVKGKPEAKDIINFLVITRKPTPIYPFGKASTQFKYAMDTEKLYAQALLESR